jgi:hypothetical protein
MCAGSEGGGGRETGSVKVDDMEKGPVADILGEYFL